ncbi:MAG TPA: hypothetical protein VIB48_07715 [Acidimicrobiia bacterium]|jgi:hypothetical protein
MEQRLHRQGLRTDWTPARAESLTLLRRGALTTLVSSLCLLTWFVERLPERRHDL